MRASHAQAATWKSFNTAVPVACAGKALGRVNGVRRFCTAALLPHVDTRSFNRTVSDRACTGFSAANADTVQSA